MAGIKKLSDKARGLQGPNHIIGVFLIDETDFLPAVAEWPVLTDINATTGLVASTMASILLAGTITLGLPYFQFAIQTGKGAAKKNEGKGLGYENYSHSGLEGEIVGVTPLQMVTLASINNKGVVAIAVYADGTRRIWGSYRAPLQFICEDDQSAEGGTIKVSFKPSGVHNFLPPFMDPATVVTVLP